MKRTEASTRFAARLVAVVFVFVFVLGSSQFDRTLAGFGHLPIPLGGGSVGDNEPTDAAEMAFKRLQEGASQPTLLLRPPDCPQRCQPSKAGFWWLSEAT